MRKVNAPRKSNQRIAIFFSFFLLLSIPLVIFGLLQENLDPRNQAYENLSVSDENPCIISFPYVNPYSLESGKTFTVQVDAEVKGSNIQKLQITDSSGNSIHTETFEKASPNINTNFKYTPQNSGPADLLGLIEKDDGESIACKISSPYDVLGLRVVNNNSSPTFSTLPKDSKPSQSVVTNENYEYVLSASDSDKDNINYSYSFTPNADWLKPLIIEDGSNGKLTIKFSGSTNKPASYLANVIIHDGYSKHISTQSWVISVSPKENDIPLVKIISPLDSLRIDKGDNFNASWEASDLNQIIKHQLFMASNPTDEDSWITVDDNIAYNKTSYTVETESLSPGTYKLIARAIDNQTPEAIGVDISEEIVISGKEQTDTDTDTDDNPIINEPQVNNMSPTSTEDVTNPRVTVKATVLSGDGATLVDENISFKLDDLDKSSEIKINKLSESAYTLIYQPQEDIVSGLHKVEIYVKDSNGGEVTKNWTFSITSEEKEDNGNISIFGYEISQRTLLIIGGGVLLLVVAIAAPLIIINVWKDDGGKTQGNSKLPPTIPADNSNYTPLIQETDIKEKVEETPVIQEDSDVWDRYSTVKPEDIKEEPVSSETKPIPLPEESKQLNDLALLDGKEIEENIPQSTEPELPEPALIEPAISEPELPDATIPEPTISEPELPEPTLPEPTVTEVNIPEPEIPTLEETKTNEQESLQQLYSQIQKLKEEEDKQKTTTNS
jgi:hypothetical protein